MKPAFVDLGSRGWDGIFVNPHSIAWVSADYDKNTGWEIVVYFNSRREPLELRGDQAYQLVDFMQEYSLPFQSEVEIPRD